MDATEDQPSSDGGGGGGGGGDCSPSRRAASAAKLQASHFVSLRITHPCLRKRAADSERIVCL
jgi:hypothetical protein